MYVIYYFRFIYTWTKKNRKKKYLFIYTADIIPYNNSINNIYDVKHKTKCVLLL